MSVSVELLHLKWKAPRLLTRRFSYKNGLWYGTGDGAESVADLGTKEAHNTDHNNCHKSEDDRIFDQALTSFF